MKTALENQIDVMMVPQLRKFIRAAWPQASLTGRKRAELVSMAHNALRARRVGMADRLPRLSTLEVAPDVRVPGVGERTEGFLYTAASGRVWEAWSSAASHGERHGMVAMQGGMALYSTRERALQAMLREAYLDTLDHLLSVIDRNTLPKEEK